MKRRDEVSELYGRLDAYSKVILMLMELNREAKSKEYIQALNDVSDGVARLSLEAK